MINLEKSKVLLSSVAVALTATLIFFKTFIVSDTLFLEALSTDLFTHGGNWADWSFSPAPAYLPDMLLYFIAYQILPDASWRIFFVSAAQVFILTIIAIWVSKQIHPKLSKNAISTIILMVAFVTLVAAQSGMWLYFYTTNNHFASLVGSLLCMGLFIRFFEKPIVSAAVMLAFIGGAAKASTAIYLISFTAPAFVLILIALLFLDNSIENYQLYRNRLIGMLAILIASHLISFFVEKVITYNSMLESRIPVTFEAAGNSFKLLLQATANAFSFDNRFTLVFSLAVVASFLFLLYRLLHNIKLSFNSLVISFHSQPTNKVDWRFVSSAMFLTIVVPVNIMGVVLSGGFIDIAGFRYLMFPIALAIILAVILIDQSHRKFSIAWNILYIVAVVLIFGSSLRFIQKSIRSTHPVNSVASCLVDIENGGFVLQEGIADYFNARGVSAYLPRMNPIHATLNDVSPFIWMSNLGPMLHPSYYSSYQYNFAILHNATDGGAFNYTPATIGKILPIPTRIHYCPDSKTQIWLYKGGNLDLALNASNNAYLFKRKLTDKLLILGANLPGITGKKEGLVRTAKDAVDKQGFLNYGPYIDLNGGRYKIVIKYSAKSDNSDAVGTFDIGRFNVPAKDIVLYKGDLKAIEVGMIEAIVKIPNEGLEQIEFRTWFLGHGQLTVKSIGIEKL